MKKKSVCCISAALLIVLSAFLFSAHSRRDGDLTGAMTAQGVLKVEHEQKPGLRGSEGGVAADAGAQAHPDDRALSTVQIGERACPSDSKSIVLSDAEEVDSFLRNASRFSALEDITLADGLVSPGLLDNLYRIKPTFRVEYTVPLHGENLFCGTESLDLGWMKQEDLEEVAVALSLLPKLKSTALPDELSFASYAELKRFAPQTDFSYSFSFGGQQLDTHTKSLSLEHVPLGNEAIRELMEMLTYLENLTELRFDSCETDDEVMARLRDSFPDREIAWRVNLPGHIMSDTIRIWLIGGYDDEQLEALKYCTKVKYLDIGHNGITKLDFLYSMPELEVLIVENDYVSDITAIGSCVNLEYLEVGETRVTDISPLANCVNLAHLNIGRLHQLKDISPLYGLTKLERLYGKCDENVPPEQVEHMRALLPDCEIRFEYDPDGPIFGSWRYQDGVMVPRYKLLHDQIGYDW